METLTDLEKDDRVHTAQQTSGYNESAINLIPVLFKPELA